MKQDKIKINNEEYIIKQNFRSFLMYEEYTNKQVAEVESVTDMLTLFYCTLKACNLNTFKYTFDEFIDKLDEDPEIFTQFNNFNAGEGTAEKKSKKKG